MNILLVAMDVELGAFKEKFELQEVKLKLSKKATVYSTHLNNKWLFVKSGVGQINSAITLTELAALYPIHQIIQFGVGGGISPSVNQGDYVIANSIIQHDAVYVETNKRELMNTGEYYLSLSEEERTFEPLPTSEHIKSALTRFCQEFNLKYKIGNIASGSSFIADKGLKEEIAKLSSSIMIEMEAAAVAYFSEQNNIPYGFIKICSDPLMNGSESTYINFIEKNINTVPELIYFLDRI